MPRERGGITYSGYAWVCGVTALLDSGKSLPDVERLCESGIGFARRSKFELVIELLKGQQSLVRSLRNGASGADDFAEPGVDDAEYERSLAAQPHLFHAGLRFAVRKLQHLCVYGHFDAGCALADRIESDFGPVPVLAQSPVFEIVIFCFFSGLVRAGTLQPGPGVQANDAFAALKRSADQLDHWASQCEANFAARASLLQAEIARLEERELDAQRLFEEAAGLARKHGLLQVEALVGERAGAFYGCRGLDAVAETYLRGAHACYGRWGADGKVRQLETLYPQLARASHGQHADGGADPLDLAALVGMYQALSQEIVLDRLIERLMSIAVETAGAMRGLLLLERGDELRIVAEADAADQAVSVGILVRSQPLRGLPQSVINFAVHTREPVIIDDAIEPNAFSSDEYVAKARPRSMLCLPLIKQQRLVGLLYLENSLSSHVFTPDRLSVLQLLAAQAAIAIENAELFRSVQETQQKARKANDELKRSFDMIPALAWRAAADGAFEFANQQWHDFTGLSPNDVQGKPWFTFFESEDCVKVSEKWRDLLRFGTSGEFEARMRAQDGEIRRFLVRATPMRDDHGRIINWHGTNTDIENLKRAEQAQEALARVSRITAMGELTVSIAHEVNQPLMAIVTNAATCLRWLSRDNANIEEARRAAERIIRDGHRAGDVIASIRALAEKAPPERACVNLREVIGEVILLIRNEIERHNIVVDTDFPRATIVLCDRVQVQQVVLNLIINAIEAIESSGSETRQLSIRLERHAEFAQVSVCDTGVGLNASDADQIYEAFFTTKADGVGIGLSICRSIIESHRGRLWSVPNKDAGTTFHFTIPLQDERDDG
jgi:PAS domain S-box-containing protein